MSSQWCCARLRPWLGVVSISLTQVRLAGHNKWSNIRHIKAARDGLMSKKNNLYSHKIGLGMRFYISIFIIFPFHSLLLSILKYE